MKLKKYWFIVEVKDLSYEMMEESFLYTNPDNEKKPTLDQLIEYEKTLRIVIDGSVEPNVEYYLVPFAYTFSSSTVGYKAHTLEEIITELSDVKWLHNSDGVLPQEVIYNPTKSIQFNKSGYFTERNDNSLHNPTLMSVVIRYKVNEVYQWSAAQVLLSNASLSSGNRGWQIELEKVTGKPYFKMSSDGTNLFSSWTNTGSTLNEWQTLIVTYDGSAAKIYQNGTNNTSGSSSSSVGIYDSQMKMTVGANQEGAYNRTGVIMHEIAMYDKVLTQAEIDAIDVIPVDLSKLANAGNLISWYNLGDDLFNDNGTWTVPDKQGLEDLVTSNLSDLDVITDSPS